MANQNTSPWTDERVEKLKDLWAKGLSCSKIAKMIGGGLTRSSIIGKVHRLGLPARLSDGNRTRKAGATRRASAATPSLPLPRDVIQGAPIPKLAAAARPLAKALPVVEDEPISDAPPSDHSVVRGLPGAVTSLRGNPEAGMAAQCRFPIGEPHQPDFHFCPRNRVGDGAYCGEHARMVSDAPLRRQRQAARTVNYTPRASGMEKMW